MLMSKETKEINVTTLRYSDEDSRKIEVLKSIFHESTGNKAILRCVSDYFRLQQENKDLREKCQEHLQKAEKEYRRISDLAKAVKAFTSVLNEY